MSSLFERVRRSRRNARSAEAPAEPSLLAGPKGEEKSLEEAALRTTARPSERQATKRSFEDIDVDVSLSAVGRKRNGGDLEKQIGRCVIFICKVLAVVFVIGLIAYIGSVVSLVHHCHACKKPLTWFLHPAPVHKPPVHPPHPPKHPPKPKHDGPPSDPEDYRFDDVYCHAHKDECDRTESAKQHAAIARYWLNRGDAELSVGRIEKARSFYSKAIDAGTEYGAPASTIASRRLSIATLPCVESTPGDRARIGRDYHKLHGDIITVRMRQQALKALGLYSGDVDGKYGPSTSASVRAFQRELGFDENNALTPIQTVFLICSAAHTARDRKSQNVLGIMHALGLGVSQNTASAIDWFSEAANRGDGDAAWNLAVLFGAGLVYSSFSLCDVVESPERADSYLELAAAAHHTDAIIAKTRYPHDPPHVRWGKLAVDLKAGKALKKVGSGC
ncbi:MAG: peptidoglycan-binding protein [Pseudomonadota bacterium]